MWQLLGNNAAQIEALGGIAAVIVATIVGWVAWKQKLAAVAQAIAADKQAEAATKQLEVSLLIADKETSPYLVFTALTQLGGRANGAIAIENIGPGIALNLEVRYQGNGIGFDDPRLPQNVLARGERSDLVIDPGRAAQEGIRISYETLFGSRYVVEFQWNGLTHSAVNRRLTKLS